LLVISKEVVDIFLRGSLHWLEQLIQGSGQLLCFGCDGIDLLLVFPFGNKAVDGYCHSDDDSAAKNDEYGGC
ncbi:MAG: hypothetical protein F083_2866, partial [bacterium F083]